MEVNPVSVRHTSDEEQAQAPVVVEESIEAEVETEQVENEAKASSPPSEKHAITESDSEVEISVETFQTRHDDKPEVVDDDEDDDYDPEITLKGDPPAPTPAEPEEDSEYDPEGAIKDVPTNSGSEPEEVQHEATQVESTILKGKTPPAGLPPKPPVIATVAASPTLVSASLDSQQQLTEAYAAIMQSDVVKNPSFVSLSQTEQMKLIVNELSKKNIQLNNHDNVNQINYDQVYSYNKPFKNLKDPIPLIPINEYCRRPNITAPMTPEEELQYDEFIKTESYYMDLQNWDEFPDKSRLFIGNLPANTISKQDLFRIFSQYGDVIQIAIKAGYGFAQFRTAEACYACIKGETDVPLHNKIMRLDASKPQKSRRPGRPEINNPNLSAAGKERHLEDSRKKRKILPDCQIYITGKSSVFYIRKVKKAFAAAQITVDTEDVTHREINEVVSEAAYSGVLGACVIKELKVDVQTFESTSDGGIKFDEYADVDPEVAAEILSKAKVKKYGTDMPAYYPQDTSHNDNSARGQPYGFQETSRDPNPYSDIYSRKRPYGGSDSSGGQRGDYGSHRGGNQGGYGNNKRGRGGRGGRDNRGDRDSRNQSYQNQGWQDQGSQQQYGQQNRGYEQRNDPYGQRNQGGQYYNQAPLQNNPYGQPQQQQQQQQPPPPQQYNQYNQSSDPNALMQQLQGMNPTELQQLVNNLQQQHHSPPPPQQRQPQYQQSQGYAPQQQSNNYGGSYNQGYGNQGPPPQNQHPNGQVETLLSRIQGGSGGYQNSPPPAQQQQQQHQQQQPYQQHAPNTSQALLETLAKLTKK